MYVTHDSNSDSLSLNQSAHFDLLLLRFGMTSCNSINLPLDPLHGFQNGDNLANVPLYQQIIRSLMYLVAGTRADLAFAV